MRFFILVVLASVAVRVSDAQGPPPQMRTIRDLMMHRHLIDRNVSDFGEGATATTRSSDKQVTGWIQKHVAQMKELVESGGVIREWDPLFAALFAHRNSTALAYTNTTTGVFAKHTGSTPCGVALVKAHAAVISLFLEFGPEQAQKEHAAPSQCTRSGTH